MLNRLLILSTVCLSLFISSEERSIIHDGLERKYIVHIPDNFKEDSPLVFVMHGYMGTANGIMEYSGMNNIADRENFIVVYPQGTIDINGNTFFNVGYEFDQYSKVDDVSFIRHLVLSLTKELNLDRTKAFATGMSNGGEMSYRLACTSSDLFLAVAPVAGVLMKELKDSCAQEAGVSLFEIHGTADKISRFEGDLRNEDGWGAYYDLPSTIEFFAEVNKLENKTVEQITSKAGGADYDIFFERHWSEDRKEEVWMYRIEEGRHVWPGLKINWWSNPILWSYFGSGNSDINASEEVWRFFKNYL